MKTTMKCMFVALALGTMTGCETMIREFAQIRGADATDAAEGATPTEESCPGCRRRWTAKPDGGVNGPPWGSP